jgi:hypothetical protein
MHRALTLLTLALATIASTASAGVEDGRGFARITLETAGADRDAGGFAAVVFEEAGKHQALHIAAHGLEGRSAFTLVIDGLLLDTFTTTPGGTFEALYESNPKGSHRLLPAALTPVSNIKLLEIKDAAGHVVLLGRFASSGGGETFEKEFSFNPTGVDPDAAGTAKVHVETENGTTTEQRLEVVVENLAPATSFHLLVDGAEVGTFTSDALGKATVIFSSDPQAGELPLPAGLSLKDIMLIEIRQNDGMVVLTTAAPLCGRSVTLASTGVISSASGQAAITTCVPLTLKIQVSGITPRAVFLARVDGHLAGAIDTDDSGAGHLELSSSPSGCELVLPSSIDPITAKLVEITNEAGAVVLSAMF